MPCAIVRQPGTALDIDLASDSLISRACRVRLTRSTNWLKWGWRSFKPSGPAVPGIFLMSVIGLVGRLGALIIDNIIDLGEFVLFMANAMIYAVMPPYKPRLLIRQIRAIGADSFFLVALIGLFTGMVLGLQGYNTLSRFGSEGALGTVVALVLVRELGRCWRR